MTSTLSILGTTIRQDAEGRFCLNDCHKAAGGLKKDGPSYFLATSKAQELIGKLASEGHTGKSVSPLKVVNDGINNGTYASKEVIYAYAMWINVDFHLTVIRAFDALVTGVTSVPTPAIDLNDPAFLRQTLLGYTEKVIALEAEKAILEPKAQGFDRFSNSIGRTNLREVGKALKIGSQRGIELLRETKWILRAQNGKWHAYADKIDAGYVEVKYATYTNTAGEEISTQQVFVTPKGMARLSTRLQQH